MIYELEGVMLNGADPPAPQEPFRQAVQDITWVKGIDGQVIVVVKDEAGAIPALGGSTPILTVRRRPSDAAYAIRKTGVIDAPAGKLTFTIASADTVARALATYYYDVQVTVGGTRWQVVPVGQFRIAEAIGLPTDV